LQYHGDGAGSYENITEDDPVPNPLRHGAKITGRYRFVGLLKKTAHLKVYWAIRCSAVAGLRENYITA
jgi:hypothetical protein